LEAIVAKPVSILAPRLADSILLAGRLLLAFIFLHEGITLAIHSDNTVKAMSTAGISAPLVVAVIALQLCAGLSVALGILPRVGAVLLGLFCLSTAMLFHTNFANHNELLHFEKDLAIAGGMFVLAAAGAGALALERRVERFYGAQSRS
jgi:putative oxidoreductase